MITKRTLLGTFVGTLAAAPSIASAVPSMTVEEAQSRFERRFIVNAGIPWTLAQTGEEYTEIIVPLCLSSDEAVSRWYDAATCYSRYKGKTLYWRVEPEIDSWLMNEELHTRYPAIPINTPVWRMYSRFLVSDKPRLFETVDEAKRFWYGRRS